MSKYAQAGFGVSVLTKLGGFYYPSSADDLRTPEGAWRVIRPIDEVVEEVAEVTARYGLRKIFFVDNCFQCAAGTRQRAVPCPSGGPGQGALEIPAWPPTPADAELIGLMKEAGCGLVMLGGTRRRRPPRRGQRYGALRRP